MQHFLTECIETYLIRMENLPFTEKRVKPVKPILKPVEKRVKPVKQL